METLKADFTQGDYDFFQLGLPKIFYLPFQDNFNSFLWDQLGYTDF